MLGNDSLLQFLSLTGDVLHIEVLNEYINRISDKAIKEAAG